MSKNKPGYVVSRGCVDSIEKTKEQQRERERDMSFTWLEECRRDSLKWGNLVIGQAISFSHIFFLQIKEINF